MTGKDVGWPIQVTVLVEFPRNTRSESPNSFKFEHIQIGIACERICTQALEMETGSPGLVSISIYINGVFKCDKIGMISIWRGLGRGEWLTESPGRR